MTDSYQSALNEIYSSFMAVKDQVKGRLDREIRDPNRIISIARNLDLLPPAAKVIRVTGSKGKGTTSRLLARYLRGALPEQRIALLVSPEEFEHTDRMSINGQDISTAEFASVFWSFRETLHATKRSMTGSEYLSPFGLFLLVALKWFKQCSASIFVLETGRGVLRDEVGQIDSAVSVVTSILLEHAASLGPTIMDIARDKLSIGRNSALVVLGESARNFNDMSESIPLQKIAGLLPASSVLNDLPGWLIEDDRLARTAAEAFLNEWDVRTVPIDLRNVSASFGVGSWRSRKYVYEAAINLDSIDPRAIERWMATTGEFHIIVSLPDDKDRERLLEYFESLGAPVTEVILDGTRGYLEYQAASRKERSVLRCNYDDTLGFEAQLEKIVPPGSFVYFSGTQTFIRLVKKALHGGKGPRNTDRADR